MKLATEMSSGARKFMFSKLDSIEAVSEPAGSGPWRMIVDEWPGSRAVYERFDDYLPRSDPASMVAGGKLARFVTAMAGSQFRMIQNCGYCPPVETSDEISSLIDTCISMQRPAGA